MHLKRLSKKDPTTKVTSLASLKFVTCALQRLLSEEQKWFLVQDWRFRVLFLALKVASRP